MPACTVLNSYVYPVTRTLTLRPARKFTIHRVSIIPSSAKIGSRQIRPIRGQDFRPKLLLLPTHLTLVLTCSNDHLIAYDYMPRVILYALPGSQKNNAKNGQILAIPHLMSTANNPPALNLCFQTASNSSNSTSS